MQTPLQITVTPEQAEKPLLLTALVAEKLKVSASRITSLRILKKSIDARTTLPKINLQLMVYLDVTAPKSLYKFNIQYQNVHQAPPVLIVGSGPAGLFAALKLIELGFKPILLERGKSIENRKTDIVALNRNKEINTDSNFCFGEGGAGTFSDGKLYTRSKKKGDPLVVFEILHAHGASEEILYETHPHIGSDLLPLVVSNISNTICTHGGEMHFEEKVTEIIIENHAVQGCKTASGKIFKAQFLILATGHSAHDVYELLDRNGVKLEQKGFAMGVRVEHPQALIDKIQYHGQRGDYLPAASYSLVEQVENRGVYSFCMCPGGRIVPATTDHQSIVVNGMSGSKRNSPFANSGIVVEIQQEDIPDEFKHYGSLAGLKYQQYIEHLAYNNNGGQGLVAPAQRLMDFVLGKLSYDLPLCSYMPGTVSSPLHFWLPSHIANRLRAGFRLFDRKMHGYLTNDAIVVGVETRSSSPVRIPRDPESGQHPDIKGLFPAGEGSGYSGGITSSAVDGQNAAFHVFLTCQ